MPRILGIVGSPRRNGNTDILVARVLESAADHGACVTSVHLADLTIRQCDGCHSCWKTGRCTKNDDMLNLYPKIAESEVLVLGTPVYWYGPTAIMKAFIDRLVFFNDPRTRPLIRGHRAALVIPFEDTTLDTSELLVQMLSKSLAYLEVQLAGKVVVPGVGERGEVLSKPESLTACEELGTLLASSETADRRTREGIDA